MKILASLLLAFAAVIVPVVVSANLTPPQPHAGELRAAIARLGVLGKVLYVAAHPDDENTRLLAWLVGERRLRTAYLSLTRGDGGQNLIGPEQTEAFGVIRTLELEGARNIDGAEQFFTRAVDFGYSKSPEEALAKWRYPEVLGDVVWAIRKFQPDVIVTRFPAGESKTHGHHTASAVLALEAFEAAADPTRFVEQLERVAVWQARRIFWNKSTFWKGEDEDWSKDLPLDVGGYDPALGLSWGEIAGRSRSMHKSQGFGAAEQRGSILEYFELLGGDPPSGAGADFLAGIDFGWSRAGAGPEIPAKLASILQAFRDDDPAASLPALLELRSLIMALPETSWSREKLVDVDNVIAAAAGLWMEATAEGWLAVRGEAIAVNATALNRSAASLELTRVVFPDEAVVDVGEALHRDAAVAFHHELTLAEDTSLSSPYWLKEAAKGALYSVDDPALLGAPMAPPPLTVTFEITLANQVLRFPRTVHYKWVDRVQGERRRPLEVQPAFTVTPDREVLVFPDSQLRTLRLRVRGGAESVSSTLRLQAPEGWKVEPDVVPLALKGREAETIVEFSIAPGNQAKPGEVIIESEKGGGLFAQQRIDYPHIPPQALLSPARARLVPLALDRGTVQSVGYVPGAGDKVAESLEQVGYDLRMLDEAALAEADFEGLDAIVVGVRAFNVNDRLRFHRERLLGWVASGGTLIVQYNAVNRIAEVAVPLGPLPFEITRERVTEEDAPVRFLEADHPALTTPNAISEQDFEGWVQERGLYFAGDIDARYATPLASHDEGEDWQAGGLLVANYGAGRFVYTGLSFFRQLPAGVLGAYRLFANLLALGDAEPWGAVVEGDQASARRPSDIDGGALVADDLGLVRD